VRLDSWPYLLLLIPLALIVWMRHPPTFAPATLRFSDLKLAGDLKSTSRVRMRSAPFWLRVTALTLLIVAAARPQYGLTKQEVISKGIDIIICLDQSGSMSGIDLKPGQQNVNPNDTRISAAKQVIRDFVRGRRNDRLGLVIFAGRAYTQCPLTLDYGILLTFLESVRIAERDSNTAIGDAIGTAVNHLKDSEAKSKVIILVTDGENNSGLVEPITAARVAAQFGIKVYTVGVGSHLGTYQAIKDFFGSHLVPVPWGLDEETLKEVSQITGATYFPAGDSEEMKEVFQRIDQMEKTELKMRSYTEYSERFLPWAALAFGFLLLEIALTTGYLRSVP
jgi:Ca-activated chloride channel family protein